MREYQIYEEKQEGLGRVLGNRRDEVTKANLSVEPHLVFWVLLCSPGLPSPAVTKPSSAIFLCLGAQDGEAVGLGGVGVGGQAGK